MFGGALNHGTNEPPPVSDWRMPKPNRSRVCGGPGHTRPCVRFSVRSRGKKNWWGGGKHAIEPDRGLGDQCAMPDGQVAVPGVRGRLIAVELPFGVHPGETRRLAGFRQCQTGVVQDRPAILLWYG